MKAAVLYSPGGSDNFVLEDHEMPIPDQGWVLVKVRAFGLNRSELMTRKGLSPNVKLPRVLGIECVGEAVADPAGKFRPGQKVAAFMGGMGRDFDGSYAEYALLPGSLLCAFDSKLSWEQLGAIPEMFQTVYGSLHLALKIQHGETILVRGGTSSIGMLATQIAKNAGLQVIATTRKTEKIKVLLDNGADEAIVDDGKIEEKLKAIWPEGVDKVLELVGASTLPDSLLCASPGGIVCMTGMLSEQWSIAGFAPMDVIPATVSLTVYDSGQVRVGRQHFQQFIGEVEKGNIRLNISRTFRLEEISQAHRFMETNSGVGKIVVLT